MRKFLAALSLLAVAGSSTAWANGFQSYKVCTGTNPFKSCAAVEITVVGNNVTMRVWNLAQNLGATYGQAAGSNGGSIIDGIGFFNVPAGLQANVGSLSVSGPVRPGDDPLQAAGGWNLKNFGSVAFSVDFRSATDPTLNGGIASGCATAGQLPGTPPNLFESPCTGLNAGGWVTFNFTTNGVAWDPRTSDISLRARDPSINGGQFPGGVVECWTGTSPGGRPANCATITPEPLSMTLLATGLAGMGGAGFLRRRRNKNQLS